METRAGYVAVGAFVLLLLAGLVAAVVWMRNLQVAQQYVYYDILFPGDVTGLAADGPVRYRGILVGHVDDIQLDEPTQKVRVTVRLQREAVIHRDSVASLEAQGITGVLYILISGGTPFSPTLPRTTARPYAAIASKPGKLEGIFANLDQLIKKASQLFNDENQAALNDTLLNIAAITDRLAKEGRMDQLLADGAKMVNRISTMSDDFDLLAKDLRSQVNTVGGDAKGAVVDLRAMTHSLTRLSDELDAMIVENRPAIKDFTTSGLYEATQLITDIRLLVADFSRVTRQFEHDPARFLFGDRRQGFEAGQ